MFDEVYKTYNMLPKFKKIDLDEVFLPSTDKEMFIQQKQLNPFLGIKPSIAARKDTYFKSGELDDKVFHAINKLIKEKHPYYHDICVSKPEYTFTSRCLLIQEDLCIHFVNNDRDWLGLILAYFPAGWNPEEIIGKSYSEIHKDIPGMSVDNAKKIVNACVNNGPFERFVWGVVYDNELNYHKSLPRAKFDINNPFFRIKIERQVTVGFPELNCFLFVLRHFYIEEGDVDKQALLSSLNSMNEEQKIYKGITKEFIDYVS